MPTSSELLVEYRLVQRQLFSASRRISTSQTVDIDVDVSVYCGTCGAGLCGNTSVDNKRSFFTVDACPTCMSRKDDEIENLSEEIERLKDRIKELEEKENE